MWEFMSTTENVNVDLYEDGIKLVKERKGKSNTLCTIAKHLLSPTFFDFDCHREIRSAHRVTQK